MPTDRIRATRRFAASISLVVPLALTAGALAQAAGSTAPVTQPAPESPVAKAESLAIDGRLVEARQLLIRALQTGGKDWTDRDKALAALTALDRRIQLANPFDISLQKAELALTEDDLRLSERHARAVLAQSGANEGAKARAQAVLDTVDRRRNELAPAMKAAIQQAQADFEAGRYEAAKDGLLAVARSGVTLTASEQATVENYQLRLVAMERERGEAFGPTGAAGMLAQPGAVRRTDQPPKPAEPAPPPAAQPAPAAPAPAPAQPPAAQPPPDDVIQAAMRADGLRILSQADADFEASRFNSALEKYQLVLGGYRQYLTAEQVSRVEARIAEARTRLNVPQLGPEQIATQKLLRDRTTQEFNNEMEQAQRALDAGDTGRARDLSARARLTASSARNAFSETEYADFMKKVEDLNRRIEAAEEQIRAQAQQQREAEMRTRAEEAERQRTQERERRINESLDRIRALQVEQRYEEALQVVDQVLFLDPRNPAALLMQDVLQDIVIYQQFWEIQRDKALFHARQTIDNEKATVPPSGIIEYPPDWDARSFRRGELSAFAESPENRRVLAQLDQQKLDVSFNDNTFADVVGFLQHYTGINVDVDWESLDTIGVTRETLVTLKLSPVPVRSVLDRVMQKVAPDQFSKAGWAVNDGILLIASDEALRRNTTMVLYDIKDLLFDVPNYDEVPPIDLQSLLQQGQSIGGGGQTPFRDNPGDDRVERPSRQERIDKIREIIVSQVDPENWTDNGGETGTIQELNGSLIIRNTPGNHREITGLLSKLREVRAMQINVETKFLLVNQDWFEQIGFDLDIIINADNNQVRTARGNDPTVQPGDFFDFSATAGLGQRGLQRTITSQGASAPTTGTPTFTTQGVVNPASWSPIGVEQNSLQLTSGLTSGDFAGAILRAAPALGVAGQFLDDVQVDFLIAATQADRRTVSLSAPRLTFTNGQTANIFVVTQVAFVSDLQPVVGDSAVGFDPTVAVASEGVTMLMEGVVSSDRRYVTLNVDAGIGRIDGFRREAVTAVAGGQLVSSADTQSFIELPQITVTRVRTTVTVPDEGTLLLGGQRLITEQEVETGVPVLSKIPILNRFFTNRIETKEESTLLVLVKPTVLIQSEQEEKNFPGLADQLQTGLR
jgi:type II secretory pathway component GspD/PulD (secretin)